MTDTHGTHGAPTGELILYETEDGQTRVDCRFADESLWLSQALIVDLFGVSVPTINEHLKSVYGSGELVPEATIRKFRIVRTEGSRQVFALGGDLIMNRVRLLQPSMVQTFKSRGKNEEGSIAVHTV